MPDVKFNGRSFACDDDETVLDALLRHGQTLPHSCRSGICQCCLMQCTAGQVPPAAQVGLKESLRLRGFFLACLCKPAGDMSLASAEAQGVQVVATVVGRRVLSRKVVQLELDPADTFDYRAGQFINLVRADGLVRSYSIANPPGVDSRIQLHIRLVEHGRMSAWAGDAACMGQRVHIRGPFGACHYLPGHPDQPLVLAGTGTGLAPLYGIVTDALTQGHRGPITLMHGVVTCEDLYLHSELCDLADRHDDFTYLPCVLNGPVPLNAATGAIDEAFRERFPMLASTRVYVCGDPAIVQSLRKQAFMAGAAMKHIHSDPFVIAQSSTSVNTFESDTLKRAG